MILGRIFCSQIRVIEWLRDCDFELQGNMDIWRLYIPDIIHTIDSEPYWLSQEEMTRSLEFVNEIDKKRYIIGKIYLRKFISNYLNIEPEEVKFEFSAFNKPILAMFANFQFNISYAGDYIIIGMCNRWSLGVDIEIMEENTDLYHKIYDTMSKEEVSSILNSDVPREVFYRHWTRKEALLKGVGTGFSDSLKEITCCEGLNLVSSDLSSFASSWDIRSFIMDNKYSVSLAYDATLRVIRFYEVGNSGIENMVSKSTEF